MNDVSGQKPKILITKASLIL